MGDTFPPMTPTMPESAGFLHSIFDAMWENDFECVHNRKRAKSRPVKRCTHLFGAFLSLMCYNDIVSETGHIPASRIHPGASPLSKQAHPLERGDVALM